MLSVSDNTAGEEEQDDDGQKGNGGGTLQIWRISDLVYRRDEEVVSELEEHK